MKLETMGEQTAKPKQTERNLKTSPQIKNCGKVRKGEKNRQIRKNKKSVPEISKEYKKEMKKKVQHHQFFTSQNYANTEERKEQCWSSDRREMDLEESFCGKEKETPQDICPGQATANLNISVKNCELREVKNEILAHMLEKESIYVPKKFKSHSESREKLRQQVVVWIFDFVEKVKFKAETGFLAVNIFDRSLGLHFFHEAQFLMLALTSLHMAAKYEQTEVPMIKDLLKLIPANSKITKQSLIIFQGNLLLLLDFNLGYPSPVLFISYECERRKLTNNKQTQQSCIKECIKMMKKSSFSFNLSSSQALASIEHTIRIMQ